MAYSKKNLIFEFKTMLLRETIDAKNSRLFLLKYQYQQDMFSIGFPNVGVIHLFKDKSSGEYFIKLFRSVSYRYFEEDCVQFKLSRREFVGLVEDFKNPVWPDGPIDLNTNAGLTFIEKQQ